MSLPAVIQGNDIQVDSTLLAVDKFVYCDILDYQRSIDEADFHPQTDPLEEESDDDTLKTSVSKSIVIETAGEESSTQMLDTSMNLEVAGDDGSIKTEAYSIEDIKAGVLITPGNSLLFRTSTKTPASLSTKFVV